MSISVTQYSKTVQPFAFLGLLFISSAGFTTDNTLINISTDGERDNAGGNYSFTHGLSENGVVTFSSDASNLVPNDFNGKADVFVRDVINGTTEMVSVRSDGGQSNGESTHSQISDDGRWVLFYSRANNLDGPDIDNISPEPKGIYLHDRQENTTILIGKDYLEDEFPDTHSSSDMNADASIIVFAASDIIVPGFSASFRNQIYSYNRLTGVLTLISLHNGEPANAPSSSPRINADGTRIVYSSSATNLVDVMPPGQDPSLSIFLHDTTQNSTKLISAVQGNSLATDFHFRPSIDDSGRWISFASTSDDLVADDSNNEVDTFLHDTLSGTTKLVSISNSGAQGNDNSNIAQLTGDGEGIVFVSSATNLLSDVPPRFNAALSLFYKDFASQNIDLVSLDVDGRAVRTNGSALAITKEGRYVAYLSFENNVVSPSTQGTDLTYLHDRGASCADNPDSLQFTLTRLNWELISLPCLPSQGATYEELFADDLPGTYLTDWIIFNYSPLLNDYQEARLDDTVVPGQGFWIIQDIAPQATLTLPQNSRGAGSSFSEADNCVSATGCRSLPLVRTTHSANEVSWNLTGHPYNTDTEIAFDDIRLITPTGPCSDGCTLDEALVNNTAADVLFSYNGSTDAYTPIRSGDTINAWSGLWAGALDNATLNETRLVMPE